MSKRRKPPSDNWGERVGITRAGRSLAQKIAAAIVIGIVMLIIFSFLLGWMVGQWKP